MASTRITSWGTWCSPIPRAIGRNIMHQNIHLHRRVLHGALVMLERSAVKVARCVLRGERSRKAPDLPGGVLHLHHLQEEWIMSEPNRTTGVDIPPPMAMLQMIT